MQLGNVALLSGKLVLIMLHLLLTCNCKKRQSVALYLFNSIICSDKIHNGVFICLVVIVTDIY